MFVCCKKTESGCDGVPDCKCKCSGCLDEWERFIPPTDEELEKEGAEEWMDDEEDEPDEDSLHADTWGCLFPEECVMPGRHLKSECHTAEMLERQE